MSEPQNLPKDGTTSDPPVRVRVLDHVAVVSDDLAKSRAFYGGVLGMREVPRPAFSFGGLWFEAGGTLVHVIEEHVEPGGGGSGPAGEVIASGVTLSRTQHMAFTVDSAVEAAERLRAAGVPIVAGPKRRPDGAAQTVIQDPHGYVIELVSTSGGESLPVEGGRPAMTGESAGGAG